MIAVYIKRKLQPDELAGILKLAGNGADIYASLSLEPELEKFIKGPVEIEEDVKKKINYDTMDFVIAFGDKKFNDKSVVEWMKFEDSSIWYYHKFRAYFRLRNLKYEEQEIIKLSKTHEKVFCFTAEPLLSGVEFPSNVEIIIANKTSGKRWNYATLFKYFMILISRWLLNLFSSGKLKWPEHIIMDVSKRQVFLDMDSLKEKKGNYVIGYLFEKTGKDFLIIDEAVQPKMSDGARLSLSRDHLCGKGKLKNRYFGEPILLNYFLSPGLRKRKKELLKDISSGMQGIYDQCSKDEQVLINIYRSYHGASNFYLIKYLAYKKFFSRHKYKTISTVDENSPATRCILDAARTAGIKTIGMQHGNIHDLHPAYIYTPSDRQRNAFPDHNIIWGEFWKEFLIKSGNYPEDSMSISGQIRTDIIPRLLASPIKKEAVITGLREDEKLIVFASQPQRDPTLRERAAVDVMQAVKSVDGAFLVIKLHPNERNDVEYYQKLAEKSGVDRILITLKVDLYLLISVCDILITCFSTVGTETVYFNKPLVILDHLQQDIQNYHKEGVAFRATNMQELHDHISSILAGSAGINKDAYKKYIAKYAYAIDGNASERALGIIRGSQE